MKLLLLILGDLNLMVEGGVNPSQWTLVEGNLKHILGGVLRGIDYFHNKGIQHSDLKGMVYIPLETGGVYGIYVISVTVV